MVCFQPTLSPSIMEERLATILTGGVLVDPILSGQIARLHERFSRYQESYPYGLWAPGLIITSEMRGVTELHLPVKEVQRAMFRLMNIAVSYRPLPESVTVFNAMTWLDLAARLHPFVVKADPADLLLRLMLDEGMRREFLFTVMAPRRHGGGFTRYPEQQAFLKKWLKEWLGKGNSGNGGVKLCCLDAACGNGTGTYALLRLLLEAGFDGDSFEVHGTSIEPMELFVAAHCYFPHSREMERAVRDFTEPLFNCGATNRLAFCQEDLLDPASASEGEYQVILCNGLIGGPFLHDDKEITGIVNRLAARLSPGGVLMAANSFHDGWRKKIPESALAKIFRYAGLRVASEEKGLVGVKY